MSKRAADAAMKAYPDCKIKNYPSRTIYLSEKVRCNDKRQSFILGYEQAEKDTIDYACYKLELRLPEYLNYNGIQVERAEFIKDFRKAMEEE